GGVHTHGDELDIPVEAPVLFTQVVCLLLADLRVERGNDADDTDLAFALGQADQLEIAAGEFGVAERVADLDGISFELQGRASEGDGVPCTGCRAALRDGKILIRKAVGGAAGQEENNEGESHQ